MPFFKSTSALVPPTPLRPYPERSLWPGRFVRLLVWLAVGLAAAEAGFWYRDGGAFPHVNVYVGDAVLGVRLMPGAYERIAFKGTPITEVRINGDGYRGAELPAPGGDEVLVVGDSQVFGLGVEEDQTFSAVLGKALGRRVVNAGVPTYGPIEYRQVIAEQLEKRRPGTVVLTINLVNDLFEAQRPNKDRHVVRDGWAVPKETAAAEIIDFPGRELVSQRSHLWFALRTWRRDGAEAPGERGAASEDTWDAGAYLRDVQQRAQAAGARLVVAILPLARREATAGGDASRALTAALVEQCRGLAISVLDATPVLAAVGPGAFLDKDVHMTPGGHAAVAAALACKLAETAAVPAASDAPPAPVPERLTPAQDACSRRDPASPR